MNDDNLEERGFISKSKLLEYVTEADIFELVFGFQPIEYEKITSPFRNDEFPDCWFQTEISTGKLRFVDFANSDIIYGIKMINIDCFDAVQVYFELKNFYKTLEFIKSKLIDGKDIQKHQHRKITLKKRRNVIINTDIRYWNEKDRRFWQKYGISKQNLIDDGVFPVKRFQLLNTRQGDVIKRAKGICYSFTKFQDKRKKLYQPFIKGKGKFITNCKADDIGGIDSLVDFGDTLVISKSYKDWRVLKNEQLDVVWFQNEGMIPSDVNLIALLKRFKNVIVFFDNDEPGIKASIRVVDRINQFFPGKASNLYLPTHLNEQYDVSDPSDYYYIVGPKHLKEFLENYIC